MVKVASLFVYPVKSCAGIELQRAQVTPRGMRFDREWMVVTPGGRFLTQREAPRLALVKTALSNDALHLSARDLPPLIVPFAHAQASPHEVLIWNDTVLAFDEGDGAASWFSRHLERPVRLVRFDDSRPRPTAPEWSQGLDGRSAFADGYPVLVLSRASLDDLNQRLTVPLPLDRFRPNVLLDGCGPYFEDTLSSLEDAGVEGIKFRIVKACARCVITTTDQATGTPQGDEPIRTLRSYRWDAKLRGVTFGQNVIVERTGWLETGASLRAV